MQPELRVTETIASKGVPKTQKALLVENRNQRPGC